MHGYSREKLHVNHFRELEAKERQEFTVKLGKLGNLEIFQKPYCIEMNFMTKTQFNNEWQK